jgi:hypothetical protein
MSALIVNGVPIECINQAAMQYYLPATLIISVLSTEGGKVGDAIPNTNGTLDFGPMQINSIWLKKIRQYGYSREQIQYDPCINVAVGAWILSQAIADGQNMWTGVGNYHSHTFDKNLTYQYKVKEYYLYLTDYLNGNVSIHHRNLLRSHLHIQNDSLT